MWLGSANLTGAGMGAKSPRRRNFEVALEVRDPELVERTVALFGHVWEGHACADCDRKNVCPVPLEEPDF